MVVGYKYVSAYLLRAERIDQKMGSWNDRMMRIMLM